MVICYIRKLIYIERETPPALLMTMLKPWAMGSPLFLGVSKAVELCSELPRPLHGQILPEDETNPGITAKRQREQFVRTWLEHLDQTVPEDSAILGGFSYVSLKILKNQTGPLFSLNSTFVTCN